MYSIVVVLNELWRIDKDVASQILSISLLAVSVFVIYILHEVPIMHFLPLKQLCLALL